MPGSQVARTLFYLACAGLFVLFSGSATGLGSPATLILLVAIGAFAHSMIGIFLFAKSLLSRIDRPQWQWLLPVAGLLVLGAAISTGLKIDAEAELETMRRGDRVLEAADDFYTLNNRCPQDFEELQQSHPELMPPSVRGTDFHLDVDSTGSCSVTFHGPMFVSCSRSLGDEDWYCD